MPPLCTPEKTKSEKTSIKEYHKEKIKQLCNDLPELSAHFDLHYQVGEGTFSSVYVATLKANNTKKYAVKHMVRTCHPARVKSELECLKKIGGTDNVVGIDLCFRNGDNIVFIMPYLKHDHFNTYVGKMDAKETALYMKNLLLAVARVHEFNIIHRDVKPSNFLYNRVNGQYLLVDFGLAQVVKTSDNAKRKRAEDSPSALPESKRKALSDNKPTTSPQPATSPESQSVKNTTPSQKENFPVESAKMYNKDIDFNKVTVTTLTTSPKDLKQVKLVKSIAASKQPVKKNGCMCYGKSRTCSKCLSLRPQHAPRAGTPGYRPPEVILKSQDQTTAVDIWACGIILLSILSNRGNFFANPDDLTSLAEMVTLFGYEALRKVASQCGQYFISSEKRKPLDLQKVCIVLRNNINKLPHLSKTKCTNCDLPDNICVCQGTILNKSLKDEFPKEAYDLLKKLLDVNPKTRITAKQALDHDFLKDV